MDSYKAARYEQHIGTAVRGLRGAETQLRLAVLDDAADELALVRSWLESCVQASMRGRARVDLTTLCRGVAASSQTSLGLGTRSPGQA